MIEASGVKDNKITTAYKELYSWNKIFMDLDQNDVHNNPMKDRCGTELVFQRLLGRPFIEGGR